METGEPSLLTNELVNETRPRPLKKSILSSWMLVKDLIFCWKHEILRASSQNDSE